MTDRSLHCLRCCRYWAWRIASSAGHAVTLIAHRVVAWPNGIVFQVIWATFWHAYVMFWLNSLSTQIYRFAQQNPFSFLRSEQIRRSVKPLFAVSGNNARLLPSIMPYTIETVWLHCIYSTANNKLITTVDIERDCAQGVWAILTSV